MITRANLEAEIVSRIGAWMTNAGLAVTIAGSNADLNGPIGWAIRVSGGATASPALVTDADVATLGDAYYDQLVDLAQLRTLESIAQSWTAGGKVSGLGFSVEDTFSADVGTAMAALRASILTRYGIGGYGAFAVALTRTDGYSELQATLDAT